MVGQQLSMQEMQLLQEFHIPQGQTDSAHAILRPALVLIAALIWLTSACSPGTQSQRLDSRTLSQATSLLDEIARAELALSPEMASRLGLDDLAGDETLSRLDDHSQAGFERKRLIRLDLLALVRSRPLLPEGHPVGRDLQIADDALTRLTTVQVIGHGQLSLSSTRPYAIDPFSGIWIDGPSLLVNDHRVETRDDVIAYLTRLQALPDAIDDTRRRLIADAKSGLVPPAALLLETKRAVDALTNPETGGLGTIGRTYTNVLQSLLDMERAEANDLSTLGQDVIENELRPAYRRLSLALAELAENAPVQAGIWAQPGGHETYQRLLNWHISDVQPLDDLHQSNMDEVTAMRARFETALNTWGLEPAPLDDRLAGLANLLAAEALVEGVPPQAASIIATKRLLSPSSLTGYVFLPARLDGRRPGVVIASDPAVAMWPSYAQPALQLDSDIGLRQPFVNMGTQRRSPARALSPYPSVLDAWQIYTAEAYLVAHLTLPEAQLGQRQLHLLYAAMAAVDTGLHHKRWSLNQSVDFLLDTTGLPEPLLQEAALRITANPGRATARMIGYRRLKALQTRASAVLGRKYDETSFQSILLTDGPRSFSMIESDVENWYERKLASVN